MVKKNTFSTHEEFSINFLQIPSIFIETFFIRFYSPILAITRGAQWSGRICCSHAVGIECGNVCAISMSVQETKAGCRRSDEQKLFECFERQENGDNCCGNARSSECLNVCHCDKTKLCSLMHCIQFPRITHFSISAHKLGVSRYFPKRTSDNQTTKSPRRTGVQRRQYEYERVALFARSDGYDTSRKPEAM